MNGIEDILMIAVGLPVICITIIIITVIKNGKKKGPADDLDENEVLSDIYYGLRDLNKRIENLETIVFNKDKE